MVCRSLFLNIDKIERTPIKCDSNWIFHKEMLNSIVGGYLKFGSIKTFQKHFPNWRPNSIE